MVLLEGDKENPIYGKLCIINFLESKGRFGN